MTPLHSSPPSLQSHLKRIWLHGFLAGFAVVLVIVLIGFFIWGWPGAVPERPEATAKPATPQAPPAQTPPPAKVAKQPPTALEAELKAVLIKLEEANQKKDLKQLMSLYAPTFPALAHKSQEISRSWAAFDYLSLGFKMSDIESPSPDNASARVTWEIKTRNRQSGEIKDFTKSYLVHFTCDAGQWHIQALDKVDKAAGQDHPS